MQYTVIDDIKGQFRKRFSSFWMLLSASFLLFPVSKASASSIDSLLRGWLCSVSYSDADILRNYIDRKEKYYSRTEKITLGYRVEYDSYG